MTKVVRGDVVLLPIAFVSGTGTKVRPAVVVQDDQLNARLNSTIVAVITSTNKRANQEACQLFVSVSTTEGGATGLLHDSTVKCEHLVTVDQRDVVRVIGRLPDALMDAVDMCIKASLSLA